MQTISKIHTDDKGKEKVEILAPGIIEQYTRRGMAVPCYFATQEMKEKNIYYLKLDELEKNPDFFTYVFKRTICKINLLKDGYYWKDAHNYINGVSEKGQKEESMDKTITVMTKLCKKAEARGTTLQEEIWERATKAMLEEEARLAVSKAEELTLAIEGVKNLSLSKTPSTLLKTLHRSKHPHHRVRPNFKKT
ncbi:MAG: hypothetical protein QRY72_04525 [Candidatus Rhabdochlamydia sp.]